MIRWEAQLTDIPASLHQVYCSRKCKTLEDDLRSAEAGALGKLAGISAARDVDLDLLRMVLRLLVTRARALGLRPGDTAGGPSQTDLGKQDHQEGGIAGEVSKSGGLLPPKSCGAILACG